MGKHGCYLEEIQNISGIGYRFRAPKPSFFTRTVLISCFFVSGFVRGVNFVALKCSNRPVLSYRRIG
ncbi:hypothetical protein C4J98_3739 [Pseudomonas orientalis]|nr:hypothetical protein C4J98_3739 [Pseudomonas orientalis]